MRTQPKVRDVEMLARGSQRGHGLRRAPRLCDVFASTAVCTTWIEHIHADLNETTTPVLDSCNCSGADACDELPVLRPMSSNIKHFAVSHCCARGLVLFFNGAQRKGHPLKVSLNAAKFSLLAVGSCTGLFYNFSLEHRQDLGLSLCVRCSVASIRSAYSADRCTPALS